MTEQLIEDTLLLEDIRADLRIGRRKERYKNRSKLYPATAELIRLSNQGASLKEMRFYLKSRLQIEVKSRTTIKNYLDKVRLQQQQIEESLYD